MKDNSGNKIKEAMRSFLKNNEIFVLYFMQK